MGVEIPTTFWKKSLKLHESQFYLFSQKYGDQEGQPE